MLLMIRASNDPRNEATDVSQSREWSRGSRAKRAS